MKNYVLMAGSVIIIPVALCNTLSIKLTKMSEVDTFCEKLRADYSQTRYSVQATPAVSNYFKFLASTYLVTGKVTLEPSAPTLSKIQEEIAAL